MRRRGSVVSARCVALLLCLCPAVAMYLLLLSGGGFSADQEAEKLHNRLAEVESHVEHLGFLDKEKNKEFLELRQMTSILGSQAARGNGSDAWRLGMRANLSLVRAAASRCPSAAVQLGADLMAPSIFDHLPHLLRRAGGSLAPALRLSPKQRRNVNFVIGIPTIHRPKVSYLVTTLRSLLDNLSPSDKREVLIVVMIADLDGAQSAFVQEQVLLLRSEFPGAIDQGFVEVVVPPAEFYPPDLANIAPTFDDTAERMFWRTKQNLDYAYLMMYCQRRARYYLQLEDDVITKPGYLDVIKQFMGKHAASPWLLLEFSSLGFIGKLFRAADLAVVVDFILLFYKEKPVDWLLDHIFYVKYCHPEKTPKQCNQVKNQFRLRIKPSLFQHVGVQSSLAGKVQKLKERDFGKQPLHRPHTDNPPANVSTSLKAYQKYTLDRAYAGETFFWALLPQKGDFVSVDFWPAVRLEGFTLRSGNAEHPEDRFLDTRVELTSAADDDAALLPFPLTAEGRRVVAAFHNQTGSASVSLNTTRAVKSLRLVVGAESQNWAILNEIHIRALLP